jgi:hypothetical protein
MDFQQFLKCSYYCDEKMSCTCSALVAIKYSVCVPTASMGGGRVRCGGGALPGVDDVIHERRGARLGGLACGTLLRGDAAAAAAEERAADERAAREDAQDSAAASEHSCGGVTPQKRDARLLAEARAPALLEDVPDAQKRAAAAAEEAAAHRCVEKILNSAMGSA